MKWEQYKRVELKAFFATPGLVDVYVSHDDLHNYVILAERYDNPAASITNAYELYIQQVCERLNIDPHETVFFECYVIPELIKNEIKLDIVLDMYKPNIAGQNYPSTLWKPAPQELKSRIIETLTHDVDLTYSYKVPKFL